MPWLNYGNHEAFAVMASAKVILGQWKKTNIVYVVTTPFAEAHLYIAVLCVPANAVVCMPLEPQVQGHSCNDVIFYF